MNDTDYVNTHSVNHLWFIDYKTDGNIEEKMEINI